MARPWFKSRWARSVPEAFERCTFVQMANISLFALIIFWQPIPIEIWSVYNDHLRDAMWVAFGMGWLILFGGAWSFGILNLLGVDQMRRWSRDLPPTHPTLRTTALYRWLRHPMYVGVLMGIWITPRMTVGHLLLATGLTLYVVIGKRYEECDLARRFGASYGRWISSPRLQYQSPARGSRKSTY